MRNNPFSPGSEQGGRMSNPADSNNPINTPFSFASPPRESEKPIAPEFVTVPKTTIKNLKDLLGNISTTFEEHGMFELAAKAESIARML